VLNFGQISVISRKRYKIETCFQWKTNRKLYVAYRMAPMLVTLNDLEGHSPVAGLFKCNPLNMCAVFYQFQLTARSRSQSATAGFLVFVSEVASKKDYLRKTACVWLCGYRHNPLSTTLPLSSCGAEFFGDDLASYRNSSISCCFCHNVVRCQPKLWQK